MTLQKAYKNPSSPWHFIVENHHFGTKNYHLFESYQPDSVKTVRMSFGTNLAETQSWLRLRNSGWETAEGWWAESRLNEVDWWFFYCHLFVLRAGQPRVRERDCSQRTQELIFLMCKVDYTICSAFNGFNTTVLLSNWWQKLNPLYFLKKNVDLVLPASTAGSRGKYIPPSLCKLHFKVTYWSIDWLSRIIHTDYFQGLNRFKTQREKISHSTWCSLCSSSSSAFLWLWVGRKLLTWSRENENKMFFHWTSDKNMDWVHSCMKQRKRKNVTLCCCQV